VTLATEEIESRLIKMAEINTNFSRIDKATFEKQKDWRIRTPQIELGMYMFRLIVGPGNGYFAIESVVEVNEIRPVRPSNETTDINIELITLNNQLQGEISEVRRFDTDGYVIEPDRGRKQESHRLDGQISAGYLMRSYLLTPFTREEWRMTYGPVKPKNSG
jgi:hypothetical protein